MHKIYKPVPTEFLLIGIFFLFSCTPISKRKDFLDLEKIEKRKEIKTNGYYWAKDYFEFDGTQCLDLAAYVFLNDFNVKATMGTGKYCGKVEQLSEDSIISLEHNRIQKFLTSGPESKFYKDPFLWGKYRTNQGKLIVAIISTKGYGIGIGSAGLHANTFEGKVLSESVIKINGRLYKFKEFEFKVHYDKIPINEK